jgi:protein-disulfide isomerase-like protein with CxxC motif
MRTQKKSTFYQSLCEKYKLDYSTFKAQFTKSSAKEQSTKDFLRARQLGVNSFPTILLVKDDKTQVIARGYAKASDMKRSIDQILK